LVNKGLTPSPSAIFGDRDLSDTSQEQGFMREIIQRVAEIRDQTDLVTEIGGLLLSQTQLNNQNSACSLQLTDT
jgi:hypothetical protein